jgi:hypothetical protein
MCGDAQAEGVGGGHDADGGQRHYVGWGGVGRSDTSPPRRRPVRQRRRARRDDRIGRPYSGRSYCPQLRLRGIDRWLFQVHLLHEGSKWRGFNEGVAATRTDGLVEHYRYVARGDSLTAINQLRGELPIDQWQDLVQETAGSELTCVTTV